MVRRDTSEKLTLGFGEVEAKIPALLRTIHTALFTKAKKEFDDNVVLVHSWKEFTGHLAKNALLLAPFCGDENCEKEIKDNSAANEGDVEAGALAMDAKSLCIPEDQPKPIEPNAKCVNPGCSLKPKFYTLFGRSY